jgi:transcription elongation factor GreB
MTDFKNYITPRGYKRLRDEHNFLRIVERPRVVDEVAHAASLGDRSENAEYIYGKKRLREIDRRLRWLHKRLAAAEVVEPSIDRGEVVFFGAVVTLSDEEGGERRLELVGEDEIETELGRISWRSPIGAALMRRREGDTVRFFTPGERRGESLEIVEVRYERQVPDPEPTRWDKHQAEMRSKGLTIPPPAILELPEGLEGDDEEPEGGATVRATAEAQAPEDEDGARGETIARAPRGATKTASKAARAAQRKESKHESPSEEGRDEAATPKAASKPKPARKVAPMKVAKTKR